MTNLWNAFGHLLPLLFLGVPIAVAIIVWRTRHLAEHSQTRRAALVQSTLEVGAIANLLLVATLVLSPSSGPRERVLDPRPFVNLTEAIGDLQPTAAIYQAGANLVLLAGFGLYLGVVRRTRWAPSALIGILLSGTLEVAQWAFATGRVASVEDVAFNTAGMLGAAWVGRLLGRRVSLLADRTSSIRFSAASI